MYFVTVEEYSNDVAIELDQFDGPGDPFSDRNYTQSSDQYCKLKKYLNTGTFSRGINWQQIKEEHCNGDPTFKGQFFTDEEQDLLSYFQTAAMNCINIEVSKYQSQKIVVTVDFNIPIGYQEVNGRRLQLYRLRMVFKSNFYLITAYPIQK